MQLTTVTEVFAVVKMSTPIYHAKERLFGGISSKICTSSRCVVIKLPSKVLHKIYIDFNVNLCRTFDANFYIGVYGSQPLHQVRELTKIRRATKSFVKHLRFRANTSSPTNLFLAVFLCNMICNYC